VIGHIFVGKIDLGLEQGENAQERLTPQPVTLAEAPAELFQRLKSLGLGFGIDQIGYALGLGQIEPAVLKGAPRELAGLCGTQALSALPPWMDSSATSSPVKLAGPSKRTQSA
jgi:hypothetical protein